MPGTNIAYSADRKNVFNVYKVHPEDHGEVKHQLVGKVFIYRGTLDVLADYDSVLRGFQNGPMSQTTQRQWAALQRNPYFEVVPIEDIVAGKRNDLIPEKELPTAPADPNGEEPVLATDQRRPPADFTYHHPLLKEPVSIRSENGEMLFNGQKLSRIERDRIMENIRNKVAQIRYSQAGASVAKAEQVFEDLLKIEPHLDDALGQLRTAVKAGHVHPDVLKALTGEIFTDPMVRGVGNKKAYNDFLSRPRDGVHVRLDGNDFGSINKIHSFEHGNHAITAMGKAMRDAMDESVGKKNGKLFRIGGDEFAVHVPTHEHAATFMRALRSKLDAIPPIGGTHKLSVSAGFGQTPEESDQASIRAKQAKKAMNYPLGQAKTHAYSAVPGFEGHIPLDHEQLPIAKPTAVAAPTEPPVSPAPSSVPPAAAPAPKTAVRP